jgi:hypothetical protein
MKSLKIKKSSKPISGTVAESKFDTYFESNKRYMICQNSQSDSKYWNGHFCDRYTAVSNQTVSVLCWKCTNSLLGEPEEKKKSDSSGKPRGWKFMKEYVDADGNVYHKGIEQPALKGTLAPSVIDQTKKVTKITKQEKQEKIHEIGKKITSLKLELSKETKKVRRREITREINKANRQLQKLS